MLEPAVSRLYELVQPHAGERLHLRRNVLSMLVMSAHIAVNFTTEAQAACLKMDEAYW